MTVRFLELGSRAERKARKVVNYAKKKANWYNPRAPGWMSKIPGHNPHSQCKLNDYRCVFSYTIDSENNRVVRHLSISVPSEDFPHPAAVKVIAALFGFTGSNGVPDDRFPHDWIVRLKKDGPIDDHCIVVGQDTGLKP